VYLVLAAIYLPAAKPDFSTFEGVQKLLAIPEITLAGWIHYLAFDLLIGIWGTRETLRLGVPRVLIVISQILTYQLGPVGFLSFFFLTRRKGFSST
jgi:hypothetical protein